MIEHRISEAMAHWPSLAAGAGLPVEGWTPDLLNSRTEPDANRAVLRLTHESHPPVVLKQGFGKAGKKSVANSIPAQRKAVKMLLGAEGFGVPEVLSDDPEAGAMLMQDAPGERLADLVDQDRLFPALERAAAWLNAFHRAGKMEERAFQPRYMLEHLSRIAAEAAAGNRALPRPKAFAAAIPRLRHLAEGAQSAQTVSSIRHGDLNARNILIDKSKVWGIDFAEAGEAPVGYDIARLLMHLTELSARPATPDLPHKQIRRAFFNGYRLVRKKDGSLPFLCYARLLSDWASLGSKEDDLSLFKVMRLERIQALIAASATVEVR